MTYPTDGSCIFCKIVAGQIPCFKLLEDANTIAFMDINPENRAMRSLSPRVTFRMSS